MQAIIGKKLGMTRVFDDLGNSYAATVIEAGPNLVTQVKTVDKDGYDAVQVGFGDKKDKHTTKPLKGHFAKAKVDPKRILQEFRGFESEAALEPGSEIKADIFEVGDIVKITGTSKGKGFVGVMRRHGFGGGQQTHGQSDRLRAPGSIGQSSWPSKVMKGMKMAGQYGSKKITVKNLEVIKVDVDNNLIVVSGAVPGANNGIVVIRK